MGDLPQRKKNRLDNYDYSKNGAYFITICVKNKHELLGVIDVKAIINRPQIQLSEYGAIVDESIKKIPIHYPQIEIDKYVIMPNHIHIILFINNDNNNGRLIIAPTNVSIVVKELKRCVSKQLGFSLWQKSFYDHIIRDMQDYQIKWHYIDKNPEKWAEDEYYG
ncbi:MAG: hypothetical protein FWF92_00865 [Oscillospiraceae bacterium]|nr:hypothetical protein [Oscillospiraceae bacterium]